MNSKKQYLKEIFLFKLNKCSIVTMLASILINIGGRVLASALHLPIWLDTTGTIVVSIQFGPIAGIITAILSQLLFGVSGNFILHYTIVGISTAFLVGLLFPRKHREDMLGIVSVSVIAAVGASLISLVLNKRFYSGYTGNIWGDSMYDMLSQTVRSKTINSFLSELFVTLPDRVLCMFIALKLVDLGEVQVFKNKQRSVTRTMTGLLAFLLLGNMLTFPARPVYAYDLESGYEIDSFDSANGLLSSEVNAVAQTQDGYLWIGTYAGLYRYNGVKFEAADVDERIRDVLALFADSKGRLWIGTNDCGVICYEPETGKTRTFATGIGLDSNSVRVIHEDASGNIYLGTVRSITKISAEGNLRLYSDWDNIYYARSLCTLDDGSMLGVSNSGILFRIKDDQLLFTDTYQEHAGIYFTAVSACGNEIMVSTTGNSIVRYTYTDDLLTRGDSITLPDHNYINNIRFSPTYNGYFYCAQNGFGFFSRSTQKVLNLTGSDLVNNYSDVCVDVQGNVWFGSSNHGLVKASQTSFGNVFKAANIPECQVNAVVEKDGLLYMGLDLGLKIVDLSSCQEVNMPWQSSFSKERIRHLMKDSQGNLWISTYGVSGLVRIDPQGNLFSFNEHNGTLGSRMRSSLELADGRILAAGTMGLSFIDGDKVVATLGESDGLTNPYILSLYEKEDGSILAASDGDGIYIIRDGKVDGHIGAAEGLGSSVVLRIVKSSEGFFYVTSNALYHDDGKKIRELKSFPYSNNFDILRSSDGNCWITSSAGLFLVNEQSLIHDDDYKCVLLNRDWGLDTTFTANSWNLLSGNDMYLCCTDGVRDFSLDDYRRRNQSYQIHLEPIRAGEKLIYEENGTFVIPPYNGRISFTIAVTNYTLSNPVVQYYLEGTNDEGVTCYQNEILPLEFTNLRNGNYTLHVRILDESTGRITSEKTFKIKKQSMMYERFYFRLYMYFVGVLVMSYIAWLFYAIHRRAKKIRGLQKEMSTDPMTGLYNKSASERLLTKMCKDSSGVLLMIDLDSFKLVNDIYGHDMGDKILIRFAELIRQAVGEGNMGGRLGGDEFIGFIKDKLDDKEVSRVTTFLNKEIVRSAKIFMGEDMNIPLGASVGAVRVPEAGTDFSDLFRYADKALYIVKQNGKHGYSFYTKRRDTAGPTDENNSKNSLSHYKKIIGERNEGKGAYPVNFEKFQTIYRFMNRDNKINGVHTSLIRITLEGQEGSPVTDEATDAFEEVLLTNLKKNDVVSRYSGQFFVLFSDEQDNDAESRISKIESKWKESEEHKNYLIRMEKDSIG